MYVESARQSDYMPIIPPAMMGSSSSTTGAKATGNLGSVQEVCLYVVSGSTTAHRQESQI